MWTRTVITLIAAGLAIHSMAGATVADVPLGDYPFNGNANDSSGNGYDGTVNGATLADDRDGNSNSAYYFDGGDSIEVPGFPSVTTYVDFSAWVRMEEVENRPGGYILNKGKYLVQEEYSLGVTETGMPWARVVVGGTPYMVESSDAIAFVDGWTEWTHIRGVYDGTGAGAGLTLYVDDVSKGYLAASGAISGNSESLYFGADYGNSLTMWEGDIDDVLIVPEPATLSLLALGGLALLRRRRCGWAHRARDTKCSRPASPPHAAGPPKWSGISLHNTGPVAYNIS